VCHFDAEAKCRIVLAVGHDLSDDTGKSFPTVGVALTEHTPALLWMCRLMNAVIEPGLESQLCLSPYDRRNGGESPEGICSGFLERQGSLISLLDSLLGKTLMLTPRCAIPVILGNGPNNTQDAIEFVGIDDADGQVKSILFLHDDIKELWQTLLDGPGAYFAPNGRLLDQVCKSQDNEDEGDDP
jgi:hypothetical protein